MNDLLKVSSQEPLMDLVISTGMKDINLDYLKELLIKQFQAFNFLGMGVL